MKVEFNKTEPEILSIANELDNDGISPELSFVRGRFENLMSVLVAFDSLSRHFVASNYICGITNICLMSYGLVHETPQSEAFQESMLMVMVVRIYLAGYTYSAVTLHCQIHAPLESLHAIDIRKLSDRDVHEVSLFVARLSGESLGISVYGMFVIDRSTVLMLVGTILTYAIIILQLNPDSDIHEHREIIAKSNCTLV